MRFLQLVTRRQHRGAEVFAAQLSDALSCNGHEVILAGLYPPPANPLTTTKADVHDLGGSPSDRLSPRLVAELNALIRKVRPDVVQANGSSTLKYASLARRVSRGRWSLVYRNIGIASDWLHYPAHRLWGKWLLGEVGHVAAVSRHSSEDLRRTFGLAASRVSTIPIGVHVPAEPRLPGARARLAELAGLPADARIIVHVGSFTPEKNHRWLIDAFGRLREERPAAHLVLVGDGPLRPQVDAAVAARGLGSAVHCLGTRTDVPSLIGGADLVVLTSTTEGISGVILEAAARAIPTVATAVGSLAEAMEDGKTGILVPLGDAPRFLAVVGSLLDDPARRRAMGDAAHAFVKERFCMDRIVGRFEQLYATLDGAAR